MQKKNFRYSAHAIQRKLERDITDEEITLTLEQPDYTLSSFEGRKIAVKQIGIKTVHVIYIDGKTHINLITVY